MLTRILSCGSGCSEVFINHQAQFIYKHIPKVGCTSLGLWFLLTLDSVIKPIDIPNKSIRAWYIEKYPFWNKPAQGLHDFLHSRSEFHCDSDFARQSNYFRFIFVRNPWKRVVSGYLDKLVTEVGIDQSGESVICAICSSKGRQVDYQKSVTFCEFVNYLFVTSSADMNHHWRPQVNFLDGVEYDLVGKLENKKDFQLVQKITKINLPFPFIHKTKYDKKRQYFNAANMSATELRRLKLKPHFKDFYTPKLKKMIAQRYREDIEKFGYNWI